MIIYNKQWLSNELVIDRVSRALESGCISQQEYEAIRNKYLVGFYKPGITVCSGLFTLTFIIAIFSIGFLSLLFYSSGMLNSCGWPIFLGLASYLLLEYMVANKHYFHSGVDNALLYLSGGLIAGGALWFVNGMHLTDGWSSMYSALIVLLLAFYFSLRFADLFTTGVAAISFFVFIYFLWTLFGGFANATAPFLMMIIAALAYVFLNTLINEVRFVNYQNCIKTALFIALITCYTAGNYYVVNMLSNKLKGVDDSHVTVPLGGFFWVWTMLVPLAYVCWGVYKKDRLLLRTGMLLMAAAVFTFRNYYHLMPVEDVLTLAGAALLAAAYATVRFLKMAPNGFTYAKSQEANLLDNGQIESLVIGATASNLSTAPAEPVTRFGGGSAGGGGSSGTF